MCRLWFLGILLVVNFASVEEPSEVLLSGLQPTARSAVKSSTPIRLSHRDTVQPFHTNIIYYMHTYTLNFDLGMGEL